MPAICHTQFVWFLPPSITLSAYQRGSRQASIPADAGRSIWRAFSNAQPQQFNDAQSDYRCNERDVIVIEPMPSKHGIKRAIK
jgi:hypothetical protein